MTIGLIFSPKTLDISEGHVKMTIMFGEIDTF